MAEMRQDASTGELVETKTDGAAQPQKDENGKPTMAVKIYAPFKVYYEGMANSVSALNESGPFDILPHHHNFICMLEPCTIVVNTPREVQKVKITRALMHVKADKVTVFVDV